MRLLLDKARHCIGFDLQVLAHDVLLAGARWNVVLIRECLATLDEQPHQPLEFDTRCTTHAAQCNLFHQQAFDARTFVLRDEGWLETLDKLASSIVAAMVLFAIMNVTIFLKLG